jgi:hypothetical protein
MFTGQQKYQGTHADVACWFSKDREGLPVYHAMSGDCHFVTRKEQDSWLDEAYSYARKIDNPIRYPSLKLIAIIVSFLLIFFPVVLYPEPSKNLSDIQILCWGLLTISSPFFIILWSKDLFILKFLEKRKLKKLRISIERKIQFRDKIISGEKRRNIFRIAGIRLGMTVFLYGFFVHGRIFPYMAGFTDNFIIMIFGIIIIGAFTAISNRLDAAHIRQTGKWFRWPRRS